MNLPHIIGFEGCWPRDVEITFGSAAILKDGMVINSLSNDRFGVRPEEVSRLLDEGAITPFHDPFPIAEMTPLWVVAMNRNSEAERIYGPSAFTDLDMFLPPRELYVYKDQGRDPVLVPAMCMFLTESQYMPWRKRVVELGLERAASSDSLLMALGLEPRNPRVHARRFQLAEERLKSRVKATARGLLAANPEAFKEYLDLIGHTE